MFHLNISFSSALKEIPAINTAALEKYLQKIEQEEIDAIPQREVGIELIFVTNREIQKLNKQYRQKDTPTDVLSFPLFDAASLEEFPLFGEIYISLPIAKQQAAEKQHSLEREIAVLFVHGVLHLLDFDHVLDTDFRQMNALEKKVLKEDKI